MFYDFNNLLHELDESVLKFITTKIFITILQIFCNTAPKSSTNLHIVNNSAVF